jgi:large subunit ribosomal protein L6
MSRVGRSPIPLPNTVTIAVEDQMVRVKGPKGQLERPLPEGITIQQDDGTLNVQRESDARQLRALHGLTRALVANMVTGVTTGFQKNLEISGVGYRAALQGTKLVLTVGYSHPVEINPPAGISFVVETPTRIGVAGIDKELVGQVAAEVRGVRKPEPYKGKGIKYQNEVIRRKAGKGGKAGGKKK